MEEFPKQCYPEYNTHNTHMESHIATLILNTAAFESLEIFFCSKLTIEDILRKSGIEYLEEFQKEIMGNLWSSLVKLLIESLIEFLKEFMEKQSIGDSLVKILLGWIFCGISEQSVKDSWAYFRINFWKTFCNSSISISKGISIFFFWSNPCKKGRSRIKILAV